MTAQTEGVQQDMMAIAMESAGRVMADVGAAMTTVLCSIGTRLGLFAELAAGGALTSAELAARRRLDERSVREWMYGMASAGYLEADPAGERFALPAGLAMVLGDSSPISLAPGFRLFTAMAQMTDPVVEAFRGDGAVQQDRYPGDLFDAMEQMSANWLETMLVQAWIPAVDGLVDRLRRGAQVADIGCGHGRAVILCARAFPESTFAGFDQFGPNVEHARAAAAAAGVDGRVRFIEADATTSLSGHYDLVTAFSVLHDAPDPVGLLRSVREVIDPDGVLLLLESNVADRPIDNAGPNATILYGTSVLYCLPTSRAGGGPGLGTLGLSPARLRALCGDAGFRSVRQLPAGNPMNSVYEVRP